MHTTYKKRLTNFIVSRFAQTPRGSITSTPRLIRNGTLQGGIVSPFLFHLFMNDLPQPTAPHIKVSSNAGDLTIPSQYSERTQTEQFLQT